MAGKIPQEFIDRLLSRVDIVDVIEARAPLKKAGKDFQALCPFHNEKSPSFTVSQDKQFYHCFGCGANGSAIGFLMDYEHMSFPEAVEELADTTGLEVPREGDTGAGGAPRQDHAPAYHILEQAGEFYRNQLRTHPQAARATEYLKGRGLSGQIAAEFGLGYAPPGWDTLLKEMGGAPEQHRQLVRAGLLVEQPNKCYDRFRDRIIFPIRDRRGRTIGFGGRVMGDDKPKYLNSPESPLFHKGHELYGLFEARKALRRIDRLMVVEGYMDVIALAQFGIRYAVATLGTATTIDHLKRLFRVSRELVFCFDGDQAGRDAAWKALKLALPQAHEGREMHFLFLPDGEDPDSLVRKIGTETFEEKIRAALPLSGFFFEHLCAEVDMHSLDGRARMAEEAKPLLSQLPPGVLREMMNARLGELVGLSSQRLGVSNPLVPRRLAPRQPQRMTPVRLAIAILLQRSHLASATENEGSDWRHLQAPGIALLGQLLDLALSQPNLTTAALIERWRDSEHFAHMNKLANYHLVGTEQGLRHELLGALRRLSQQTREQETELLYSKTRLSDLSQEDKERLKRLLNHPSGHNSGRTGIE